MKETKVDTSELIFFIFILSLYVVLKKWCNCFTYTDFVFSKLHIQPDALKWPVLISLLPVAVAWIPRINFREVTQNSINFYCICILDNRSEFALYLQIGMENIPVYNFSS